MQQNRIEKSQKIRSKTWQYFITKNLGIIATTKRRQIASRTLVATTGIRHILAHWIPLDFTQGGKSAVRQPLAFISCLFVRNALNITTIKKFSSKTANFCVPSKRETKVKWDIYSTIQFELLWRMNVGRLTWLWTLVNCSWTVSLKFSFSSLNWSLNCKANKFDLRLIGVVT